MLNVGAVSGTIALDSQNIGSSSTTVTDSAGNTHNTNDGDDIEIEQAHFTYTFKNAISLALGRYGSAFGFEHEDPAGLYTYSRTYGNAFDLDNVDSSSVEGLIASYAAEAWSLQVSIDNPSGTIRTAGTSKNDLDYEVALSYTGVENLVLNVGYRANDALNSLGVSY